LLADAMARHGHSAGLTLDEDVIVVDVVFQGRSHDIPGLAAALAGEAEQRARLLSAREREILENSSGRGCCPPGNGRSWRTTCSMRWPGRCTS
jgi:hypothetical protein